MKFWIAVCVAFLLALSGWLSVIYNALGADALYEQLWIIFGAASFAVLMLTLTGRR